MENSLECRKVSSLWRSLLSVENFLIVEKSFKFYMWKSFLIAGKFLNYGKVFRMWKSFSIVEKYFERGKFSIL